MRRAVVTAALLLAFAACSDSTGPGISIAGSWVGTGGGGSWTVGFVDSAGVVAGGGKINGSINVDFTGTHSGNHLNLTILALGYSNASYTATVTDATHIHGTLSGSGFSGNSLSLIKQ
jgi:hypothetical protein